ncbi:MAG: FtsX-like permease family protein, partial [Bacteroidota bacterium]
MDYIISNYGVYKRSEGWDWSNFYTYIEMEDQVEGDQITSGLDQLLYEHWGHDLNEMGKELKTTFQPIKNIYLDPAVDGDGGLYKGSSKNILIFSLVAILIFAIAMVNYVNLASARAILKKEEVAIRKSIGANKRQLLVQFMCESILFVFLSFVIALLLVVFCSPILTNYLSVEISFTLLTQVDFWLLVLTILFGTSLLIGIYPASMSLKLANVGASKNNEHSTKSNFMRQVLIVFQLAISLILIAGTWLVYNQVTYMRNQDLGIEMDQILVLHGPRVVIEEGFDQMKLKHNRFKNTLLENVDIHAITGSSNIPGTGGIW